MGIPKFRAESNSYIPMRPYECDFITAARTAVRGHRQDTLLKGWSRRAVTADLISGSTSY